MASKKRNPKKETISNLTDPPSNNDPFSRTFWPREIKLANSLWLKYPEDDFWVKLSFPWKMKSLAFLKTERGSELLKNKYNEYKYKPPEMESLPVMESQKVGKDLNLKRKGLYLDEL
tara:strand:+ start:6985 stop:7335 length:351 start_codon:yes stop_codon:yes gene_type:complete